MITTTYYFPRNSTGRYVLDNIARNVGCSVGNIHRVADTIAVPITAPKREIPKIKSILQMYDLI